MIQVSSFVFYTNIETGFVGVLYYQRKIQDVLLQPGKHWYSFLSEVEHVETRPQSDFIRNVECMTNEGLIVSFKTVEVGNQLSEQYVLDVVSRFGPRYDQYLIMDLIRHQINVICSKKSLHQLAISEFDELDDLLREHIQSENDKLQTCLKIMFVRLPKPTLPPSIEKNYLALAEEKTLRDVIVERTHRVAVEKDQQLMETEKDNIRMKYELDQRNLRKIEEMKASLEEQRIKNVKDLETAETLAESMKKEAEATEAMYKIQGYKEVLIAQSLHNNEKIYYGDKIPQIMMPNMNLNTPIIGA
jgi:erlin